MTSLDRLEALEREATPEGYRTKRNAIEYDAALKAAAPALIAVAREAARQVAEAHTDDVDLELAEALTRLNAEAPE